MKCEDLVVHEASEPSWSVGQAVSARFMATALGKDTRWFPGKISAVHGNEASTFALNIMYNDGDYEENVLPKYVKAMPQQMQAPVVQNDVQGMETQVPAELQAPEHTPAHADQPNCGVCVNCKDMPKFGGPNKIRQRCVLRATTQRLSTTLPVRDAFQRPHKAPQPFLPDAFLPSTTLPEHTPALAEVSPTEVLNAATAHEPSSGCFLSQARPRREDAMKGVPRYLAVAAPPPGVAARAARLAPSSATPSEAGDRLTVLKHTPAHADQPNCGVCVNCKDMPKFGGPNKIRQRCVLRATTQRLSTTLPVRDAFQRPHKAPQPFLPDAFLPRSGPHKKQAGLTEKVEEAEEVEVEVVVEEESDDEPRKTRRQFSEHEDDAILRARANGVRWADIGRDLGRCSASISHRYLLLMSRKQGRAAPIMTDPLSVQQQQPTAPGTISERLHALEVLVYGQVCSTEALTARLTKLEADWSEDASSSTTPGASIPQRLQRLEQIVKAAGF